MSNFLKNIQQLNEQELIKVEKLVNKLINKKNKKNIIQEISVVQASNEKNSSVVTIPIKKDKKHTKPTRAEKLYIGPRNNEFEKIQDIAAQAIPEDELKEIEASKKLKFPLTPRIRENPLKPLKCIKCGTVENANPDLVYGRGYICNDCIKI